ncbi:MAG: DUF421 domain-containing protein [Flavobacteriales bacterium]
MHPFLEIILRSAAVYVFILLAIRLFGKKELSQLSVIDLVFILLLSNSVQNAMVGADSSLTGGIIAAGTLFIINNLLKELLFRSRSLSKLLEGEPVLLVHHGVILEENLKREKISIAELKAAAREHGVALLDEVDLAVLETDGNISILSGDYRKRSSLKREGS